NPALTVRELAHAVSDSDAAVAVARSETAAALAAAGVERIVLVDDGSFAELGAGASLADPPVLEPETPVELVYTSGVTAASKAAVTTHANGVFWGWSKAAAMELSDEDRLLSALPVFHVNAQSALLAALTAGSSLVLLERYSASRYCEQLAAHGITV